MRVRAVITTKYGRTSYVPRDTDRVESYMVDGAMDTDTDTWMLRIGDIDHNFISVLERDNEVRINLFTMNDGRVDALHTGFADAITMNEDNFLDFSGRDMTAVAVDSQHPPQIWHHIRPKQLVTREARALKIADRLRLQDARPFKTYGTDGGESYWQVWYRFYRKRRMWLWAEPDGALIGSTLDYNQPISYFFGTAAGVKGVNKQGWIPVETAEIRSDKTQRVGDVFIFGHRGDTGFVAHAGDPTTLRWIKRPTLIQQSSDVHNQAEARIEAWEEIFESKVGALEVKIDIPNPGYMIRQNRMARVNIPSIGLRGDFYVVGVQGSGDINAGHYLTVRLREKNYAITRRVPVDPSISRGTATDPGGSAQAGIAGGLPSDINWREFFTEAAQKFHGPWSFSLFLGVILAICEVETGFRNERRGGHEIYPGTSNGQVPSPVFQAQRAAYDKFVSTFANEKKGGYVNEDYAVGPMQLLTEGFKLYADRLFDPDRVGDELLGGRWDIRSNILAGAAALASKLGAGVTISPDGQLRSTKPTGLSLNPSEQNIWSGVGAYGEGDAYAVKVRALYKNKYSAEVQAAINAATTADRQSDAYLPAGSISELQKRVLNNTLIIFTRQSQRDDIKFGMIVPAVLQFLLWMTENKQLPVVITALKSDHKTTVARSSRPSAHIFGKAVDMGNYNLANRQSGPVMEMIGAAQQTLGFSQLIGPVDSLVIPLGYYDQATLADHDSHIHVGWPLTQADYKSLQG